MIHGRANRIFSPDRLHARRVARIELAEFDLTEERGVPHFVGGVVRDDGPIFLNVHGETSHRNWIADHRFRNDLRGLIREARGVAVANAVRNVAVADAPPAVRAETNGTFALALEVGADVAEAFHVEARELRRLERRHVEACAPRGHIAPILAMGDSFVASLAEVIPRRLRRSPARRGDDVARAVTTSSREFHGFLTIHRFVNERVWVFIVGALPIIESG